MEKTTMKKIKLLTILAATITATSAFADCAAPATPSEAMTCAADAASSVISNVAADATKVYKVNSDVGTSIYSYFDTKGRGSFNFNALAQSVYYGAAVYNTTGPDLANIYKAAAKYDVNGLRVAVTKLQADRAALVAPGSKTEFAAKAAVYAQIELLNKYYGVTKNNKLKVDNYATDMFYTYYAPALAISLEQFAVNEAPKYLTSAVNTMTQAMCEAQVVKAQGDIKTLSETDPKVDYLLELGKPGSFQKALIKASAGAYASDALDMIYTYATGMNAEKKNTPFNICDYNAFLATTQGTDKNVYSVMLNDAVAAASAKTGVSPEKIYWSLTAISAMALDRGLSGQTAPIAGTAVLPY
jgi:hypothetical protein